MIEAAELLTILQAACYRYISESEMRCLAYFALGYPTAQICDALSESPATVNRHLKRVREAVELRAGIKLSNGYLRAWVWCHLDGCTSEIPKLIEIFSNIAQTQSR